MDPKTSEMCNNQGSCSCNHCDCNRGFHGKFCQVDSSVNQDEDACEKLAPCILSDIYGPNKTVDQSYKVCIIETYHKTQYLASGWLGEKVWAE